MKISATWAIGLLLATVTGQQAYIFRAKAATAAWRTQTEVIMTERKETFERQTDSVVVKLARYEAAAQQEAAKRDTLTAILRHNDIVVANLRTRAADTTRADIERIPTYSALVTMLDSTIAYQAKVIDTYRSELDSERAAKEIVVLGLERALERIAELERAIEAAPGMQARGGGLKTFLAGAATGVAAAAAGVFFLLVR